LTAKGKIFGGEGLSKLIGETGVPFLSRKNKRGRWLPESHIWTGVKGKARHGGRINAGTRGRLLGGSVRPERPTRERYPNTKRGGHKEEKSETKAERRKERISKK